MPAREIASMRTSAVGTAPAQRVSEVNIKSLLCNNKSSRLGHESSQCNGMSRHFRLHHGTWDLTFVWTWWCDIRLWDRMGVFLTPKMPGTSRRIYCDFVQQSLTQRPDRYNFRHEHWGVRRDRGATQYAPYRLLLALDDGGLQVHKTQLLVGTSWSGQWRHR